MPPEHLSRAVDPSPFHWVGIIAEAGGILGELVTWMTETARYPQPLLALGAAIATVGALAGHRYHLLDGPDTRTNTMILGLAGSGSGKEHPRKAMAAALREAGLEAYFLGRDMASAQGIHGALANQFCGVMMVDEVGLVLSNAMHDRAPSHLRAIAKLLMELATSATGVFLDEARGANRDPDVVRFDIVLLCAASPVMLLLVERGNNDGLILLLTLAGLRWSGVGGGMALGLAAGLKLYPIVAVPLAIRPPNERWRMAGLLLCAPLILWTVLQWDEIAAATPQAFWTTSFGAATTSLMLTEAISRTSIDLPPMLIAHPALIGRTTWLLAAAALWLVARNEYIQLDELIATAPPAESRMVEGFSLIFAALFVSGSSFAYRCVFVLPILWFFHRHRACPPCRTMLALGLGLLWFPWLPHGWELFNLPAFLLAIALSPMLALFGDRLVRGRLSTRSVRARAPSPRP
jgi:hypothetical protein